jgi:hypothetical protein
MQPDDAGTRRIRWVDFDGIEQASWHNREYAPAALATVPTIGFAGPDTYTVDPQTGPVTCRTDT